MEIQSYLRTLRTRWKSIVLVTVLAVVGAATVSLLTTPIYSASTQLFVSTPAASDSGAAYTNGLYSQQRVASYSELLKGPDLAQKVVDSLQLPVSAAQLAGEVTVVTSTDTVLLNVSVADPSASRAQAVANALSEQFTTLVAQLETPAGSTRANATVTVTQRAGLPTVPVAPQTSRNLVLAFLVGIVLGLALAVLRERLDNTVKQRSDLVDSSGSAVVGTIPFDPDRPVRPLIAFGEGHSASAEAYRQIRTNLQFLDVDTPPRVIVVTSAVPSEGKTVTSLNLAFVLAEAGHRVALVEADLRRPRLARYLKLLENVGLTNVLSGSAELEDVLQETVSPGVVLLGSGPHPPNPSELLGSSQMRTLVGVLRERYDYVVLDAPPLLPVTDAAVLSTLSDGALLVARHGHTKRDQLSRATDNLRSIDAKILGSVLNMVPAKDVSEYEYAYYLESDPSPEPAEPAESATSEPGATGAHAPAPAPEPGTPAAVPVSVPAASAPVASSSEPVASTNGATTAVVDGPQHADRTGNGAALPSPRPPSPVVRADAPRSGNNGHEHDPVWR